MAKAATPSSNACRNWPIVLVPSTNICFPSLWSTFGSTSVHMKRIFTVFCGWLAPLENRLWTAVSDLSKKRVVLGRFVAVRHRSLSMLGLEPHPWGAQRSCTVFFEWLSCFARYSPNPRRHDKDGDIGRVIHPKTCQSHFERGMRVRCGIPRLVWDNWRSSTL